MIHLSEGPTKLTLEGDGREIAAVTHKLRYHPNGYFHSPSFKAYQLTNSREGWDGFLSPIRYIVPGDARRADCLRGHKDAVVRTARNLGFVVSQRDCLQSPFHAMVADDLPDDLIHADFELDEYQREAVIYWLANGMGVNKIAINGGKSALFSAATAMIKRHFGDEGRILYITQSERLVRQAFKDMRGFLPQYDITQYGGGKSDKTGKDMVIATFAMLWKNHLKLLREQWFQTFICVQVDECHHLSSPSGGKIMLLLPSFFRFGASDTARDKNKGDQAKIRGLIGPIRYVVPVSTYIDIGRSARPTINIISNPAWEDRFKHLPHRAEIGSTAWCLVGDEWRKGTYQGQVFERDEQGHVKLERKSQLLEEAGEREEIDEQGQSEIVKTAQWEDVEVPVVTPGFHTIKFDGDPELYELESTYCLLERVNDQAIVRFKERNQLIVDWTRYYSQARKFTTLIVCTRTLHIYILEAMVKAVINPGFVQILLGEHTSKERDRAFEWWRHTPGGVLISPLVQEGVSINEIRAGVIADYVGEWERGNQIIGRFIRKKQVDNTAHITWFYDNTAPSLKRGSMKVLNKLIDIRGYTYAYPCLGPDSLKTAKIYEHL